MFEGFSPATYDFLLGIAANNERIWFNAHKEDYVNYLQKPMKALADEVFDALIDRCPDRDLICKVARIYKDARRCHGLEFYKTSLWFSILPPVEQWQDAPGFWFEVGRDGWSYGMGMFAPKAATMARHRAAIDAAPDRLVQLNAKLLRQHEFVLSGQSYAKFKEGAPSDLAGWYNLKSFNLIHDSVHLSETFDGPALVQRLVDGFAFLMPFYDYFYEFCEASQAGIDPLNTGIFQ